MHSEVGVYLQMEAWNEDDSHPNYVEHVNPSTFAFDFLFWISLILCAFYFVFDIIFHQSKHKAVVHLSSLSTWYSQADPGLQAPHHGCHLETPGGGPAPPSSCSKGSTVWCKSSVHADLHEQPCRAPGAAEQGKLAEAGRRSLGWEVTFLDVSPRAFFGLAKAWSLKILFVSRYCWMIFGRTN